MDTQTCPEPAGTYPAFLLELVKLLARDVARQTVRLEQAAKAKEARDA